MKTDAKRLARGLVAEIQAREASELDAVVEAFVHYLAEQHALSRWREIVRALEAVWKEEFGVGRVDVVSATELQKELKKSLEEKFTGATVTVRTDKSVLGGAAIRIDDRVVDGTLRTRLQSLKQQLAS